MIMICWPLFDSQLLTDSFSFLQSHISDEPEPGATPLLENIVSGPWLPQQLGVKNYHLAFCLQCFAASPAALLPLML